MSTTIHRHTSSPEGAFVNAYLVEGESGVVAVDSTLTVSDSSALCARLEALGKPLLAVLVTHAHPDHYGGLTELVAGDDVPIVAVAGVDEMIRRDDELKDAILRPMFGDEWPRERTFPNRTTEDGETIEFEDLRFTVLDLGPSESPHDSVWLLGDDRRTAFPGDQVYNRMHQYLADGFYEEWLANLGRLRSELPPDATLHIGHGEPVGVDMFEWEAGYIETFVAAVKEADWSDRERARDQVVAAAKHYLPAEELQFLMELSPEPVAAKLGLLDPPSRS